MKIPDGHPWDWSAEDFYRLGTAVYAECPFASACQTRQGREGMEFVGRFRSEERSYSSTYEAAQQLSAHLQEHHRLSESETDALIKATRSSCLRARIEVSA